MNENKQNPEYYAERIFCMIELIKNYCDRYDYISEIDTITPAVEYIYDLSDKLYSYCINSENTY